MNVLSLGRIPFVGSFGRKVAVVAGATAIAQLATVASTPILTRLYSPHDFGMLAVFGSIISIGTIFLALRYHQAIPVCKTKTGALNVGVLAGALVIGVSAGFAVLMAIASDQVAAWIGAPAFARFAWLLAPALLFMGIFEVINIWMIRERSFDSVAKASIARGVTQPSAQLLIPSLVAGPFGLLLGVVLGSASATALHLVRVVRTERNFRDRIRPKRLAWAARRFAKFPIFRLPTDLLNTLLVHLPALLIAAIYGPIHAGLFLLAHRLLGLPIMLVGRSTGQVFLGEMSHCLRKHPERSQRLFANTTLRLFAIASGLLIPFALLGPHVFGLVFGADWADAGGYFRSLSLMFVCRFSAAPDGHVLTLLERHRTALVLNVLRALIVATVFLIAAVWDISPYDCVTAFSLVMSFGYVAQIAACWYLLKITPKQMVAIG